MGILKKREQYKKKLLQKIILLAISGITVLNSIPHYALAAEKPSRELVWMQMDTMDTVDIQTKPIEVEQIKSSISSQKPVTTKAQQDNPLTMLATMQQADSDKLLSTFSQIQKDQQHKLMTVITAMEQKEKQKQEDQSSLIATINEMKKRQEQQDKEKQELQLTLLSTINEMKKYQEQQDKQKKDDQTKLLTTIEELKAQKNMQDKEKDDINARLLAEIEGSKRYQEEKARLNIQIAPVADYQEIPIRRTMQQYVQDNTQDATEAITKEADISFFYSSGGLYRIYCKDGYLTDIQLQAGEEITGIVGGDTVRWMVDQATSGSGNTKQSHVYLKPLKPGLETNLIITTNKHSYQIQAKAVNFYNPIVGWTYPQEEKASFIRQREVKEKQDNENFNVGNISADKLNFSYKINSNDRYSWTPTTVFDDGARTYIRMPEAMKYNEAPILFIKEGKNLLMVNYRIKNNMYIVDRLFKEAHFKIGNDTVKIKKNEQEN